MTCAYSHFVVNPVEAGIGVWFPVHVALPAKTNDTCDRAKLIANTILVILIPWICMLSEKIS